MAHPGSSRFTLDDQLCFALYASSRAMTGCYRPLLEGIGLTYPQYLVMLVLWERDEATVGCIGQSLQLETGTLSPLLKRLESNGLIRRRRQRHDERSVVVELTAAGRELRDPAAAVQSRVENVTGLDRRELAELRGALHALTARLRSGPATAESA